MFMDHKHVVDRYALGCYISFVHMHLGLHCCVILVADNLPPKTSNFTSFRFPYLSSQSGDDCGSAPRYPFGFCVNLIATYDWAGSARPKMLWLLAILMILRSFGFGSSSAVPAANGKCDGVLVCCDSDDSDGFGDGDVVMDVMWCDSDGMVMVMLK